MTDHKASFRAGALLFSLFVACSGSGSGSPFTAQNVGGAGGQGGFPSTGGGSAESGGTESGGAATVPGSGGQSESRPLLIDGGSTPYPYDLHTTFTWPETDPASGAGSLCQSGHYVGTYSCNVTFGDAGNFNYPLTGPVDLRLAEAQNGEFLSVSGGTLTSAAGILSMNASLVGKLSCQTGAFSGTLQNGTLAIPPFPPGGNFSGNLSAEFESTGPKLGGTWTLIGEGVFAGYECHGPWTATWQPN